MARRLDLVAPRGGERHADQRPLDLRDHPVIDVGRREAVLMGGQELP